MTGEHDTAADGQAQPATGGQPVADRGWRTLSSLGIGSASILADAGHEVATSLLPSFLTSTLGAPAAALGLIEDQPAQEQQPPWVA